jgi:hypothetical protein
MDFKVEYNFYLKYLENQDFKKKFEHRVEKIKNIYNKNLSQSDVILEYFVEIFSWSVLPIEILKLIESEISKLDINLIIDPSCGSAFHGFLFQKFCKFKTINLDLQNETFSWIPIIEGDGRHYLKNLNQDLHCKSALLLSWIDYEDLCLDLLNLYQGDMVISFGNYNVLCPKYKLKLEQDFILTKKITLNMPWGLDEDIELYVKKN